MWGNKEEDRNALYYGPPFIPTVLVAGQALDDSQGKYVAELRICKSG